MNLIFFEPDSAVNHAPDRVIEAPSLCVSVLFTDRQLAKGPGPEEERKHQDWPVGGKMYIRPVST